MHRVVEDLAIRAFPSKISFCAIGVIYNMLGEDFVHCAMLFGIDFNSNLDFDQPCTSFSVRQLHAGRRSLVQPLLMHESHVYSDCIATEAPRVHFTPRWSRT